jgi:hypothetical protein
MTEGGVFSFSHSIFIYPLEFLAKEKELDKASKFLGAFEVEFELEDGKLTFPTLSE